MRNEYLEGGRICTAHGVRGLVKVEHLCDRAEILLKIKKIYFKTRDGFAVRGVRSAALMGQFVLLSIDGIDSREDAISYRGKSFYLHRDDVPLGAGAMFIADMIGIPVVHAESGEGLGTLCDVSEVAGRRIYTVETEAGRFLVPDVPEFIKEISEERGMAILPIPGLLDDGDEV